MQNFPVYQANAPCPCGQRSSLRTNTLVLECNISCAAIKSTPCSLPVGSGGGIGFSALNFKAGVGLLLSVMAGEVT